MYTSSMTIRRAISRAVTERTGQSMFDIPTASATSSRLSPWESTMGVTRPYRWPDGVSRYSTTAARWFWLESKRSQLNHHENQWPGQLVRSTQADITTTQAAIGLCYASCRSGSNRPQCHDSKLSLTPWSKSPTSYDPITRYSITTTSENQ
jgi:hypothetical protein